jgi:hypothetical protein
MSQFIRNPRFAPEKYPHHFCRFNTIIAGLLLASHDFVADRLTATLGCYTSFGVRSNPLLIDSPQPEENPCKRETTVLFLNRFSHTGG